MRSLLSKKLCLKINLLTQQLTKFKNKNKNVGKDGTEIAT